MKTPKKIIYIFPCDEKNKLASGFERKVQMQRTAFEKSNISCDIERLHDKTTGYYMKILRRLTLFHLYSDDDLQRIVNRIDSSIDAVYIRRPFLDISVLNAIKKIKNKNPTIKLLWEIPTYPYDNELKRIIDISVLFREKVLRRYLKLYIDRIITVTKDKKIFEIPCINIDNGIDCERVAVRAPISDNYNNEVHLLGVAQLAYWHGYDRVIKGLHEYYRMCPNRKVYFHIVGDGAIRKNLEKLCNNMNVDQYVHFHGWVQGDKLNDIFDECDIGVGCLGSHRKKLIYTNSLKLREYAARGIPFFYGDTDLIIEEHFKEYLMHVPANDDPIVISDVIRFYDEMNNIGFQKIAFEMRKRAEEKLSWAKQMQPVIDYIFSEHTDKE